MGKKAGLIILLCVLLPAVASAQRIQVIKRVTPTAGGGGSQPPIWSDNTNTRGVWFLEETGTTDRDNAQGTATRDLAESTSFNNDTSAKQGTYSNSFTAGPYLECTDANCGGTSALDLTGAYTIGCWVYPTSSSNLRRIIAKGTSTASVNSTGYMMGRTSSSTLHCENTTTESVSSASSNPVNTWTHSVCRWDATNLRPYIDGVASGSNVASVNPANVTNPFRIGARSDATTANQTFDGLLDECFVVRASMSDAQICRVARCGFDGEFCVCDDSPTTSYKPCYSDADCKDYSVYGTCNTTDSTCSGRAISCTLPNCDDTGP